MAFENNVLGMVPKKDWLSIPFNPQRPSDPVSDLFGDVKTDNIAAEWSSMASQYGLPLMAQFHSFDTVSQQTFRKPVDKHEVEKGLIKVSIPMSERLRALVDSGVTDDALYRYVIEDGARLAEEVITRTYVAKNEVLATGQMTIKENNLDITIDYGVTSAQKSLELDVSDTADIFSQLETIVQTARNGGCTITGMVTSRKVLGQMRRNPSLQKAINGANSVGVFVTASALAAFLETEFGITQIIQNDMTYGVPNGVDANNRPQVLSKRYYPENKISFFGTKNGAKLGAGLWGNPPEKDIAEFHKVQTSGVDPYVYITQWSTPDPATIWTKASALFIPVLYDPTSLWIATVTEPTEEDAGG